MSTTVIGKSGTWRNWAGNVTARPVREVTPATVEELAAAVRRAAEDDLRVKAVGTGHSFTAAAATDGVLIRPQLLTGIRKIDREAMTVTVAAGTPLKRLNMALAREGHVEPLERGAGGDRDGHGLTVDLPYARQQLGTDQHAVGRGGGRERVARADGLHPQVVLGGPPYGRGEFLDRGGSDLPHGPGGDVPRPVTPRAALADHGGAHGALPA